MKCPNCQYDNLEGALFCGKCGQSLQTELVCPQCGQTNPQDHEFCNRCGHALAEPAPRTPVIPPSPEPTSFVGGRYQVKKLLGEGVSVFGTQFHGLALHVMSLPISCDRLTKGVTWLQNRM